MIDEKTKSELAAHLKHYLATPSDVEPLYKEYSKGKADATFSNYTHELEALLESLQTDKFKKHEDFCKEIKRLKLPHNQFDCKPD